MIQLIYISAATSWPGDDDLLQLLNQARNRNLRQNITGLLLYTKATYIQVLEGEEKDVHEIFAAIQKDPRNTGVVKLIEKEIEQRDFPDWCMAFKNLDKEQPENIPGYIGLLDGKLTPDTTSDRKNQTVDFILGFARTLS